MNICRPEKGEHTHDWGTKVFDFGKNEVKNFSDCQRAVLAGAVSCGRPACGCSGFYPLSGLWRRQDGQWVPNKYGGNKNLEAIEFFKHLNSVVLRKKSREADDCRGVYRMADGNPAGRGRMTGWDSP